MKCKRCGKALGTDRGICPFCGAMLSKEQMDIYKHDKKENMLKPELLTEKYGEKPVYYEKQKDSDSFLYVILGVLLLFLILGILILVFVLN